MGRSPRPLVPGGTFHVMSNGARNEIIFRQDEDRRDFLRLLDLVVVRHEWVCLSYALLGTHFHLVVQTPNPDLDRGMQLLKSGFAVTFNRRDGGRGAVFRERYASVLIQTEAQLYRTIGYVELNAVRAGIVPHPERWPWASYRALVGLDPAPRFLAVERVLEMFGPTPEIARTRLRAFVEETLGWGLGAS